MLAVTSDDEMTEEEESAFDAAVADPSLIKTEAEARGVLFCVDADIEDIRQQLSGAKIEADISPLPPHRQEWVRKASIALAWKLRQRSAVGVRLADFQPPPPSPIPDDPEIAQIVRTVKRNVADRSEKVRLAELRITQEGAIRARKAEAAAAKLQNIAASNARKSSQEMLFVKAARKLYSVDECQKIWDRAKADYPNDPCWN